MTNVKIEFMETGSGKTIGPFSTDQKNSFPKPLLTATIGNTLAIVLADERILIYGEETNSGFN